MSQQLALPVNLRDDATFTNFYPGDNTHLIKALHELVTGNNERLIYCWGHEGAGRSHLLQACCHELTDQQFSVVYLPLSISQLSPEILEDLEHMNLVCLDDINAVLGNKDWEEALLHFYNRARDNHVRLVVSGNEAPPQLPCELADLRSRLSWGLVFQVAGLSDDQKLLALQMHAHQRGLQLTSEVGQFLLRHYPRDMSALFTMLNKLDHASLVAKRRLTIPFIKQVLGTCVPAC